MKEGELPPNPHNEWMDRLMLKLDTYPRRYIKDDPYWEFLYQHVKKTFSAVWWGARKVWKLNLP